MPRFIDSAVGSRSLTIPEATDLFDNTANVQDGSPMLVADCLTSGSPQYCHTFDRAAGSSVYSIYDGQARTIVLWAENLDLANFWPWVGCAPITSPGSPNWYIDRQSGSGNRRLMLFNSSAGYNQLGIGAGTDDGGSPEMLAFTFTGVSAASTNVRSFHQGAFNASTTLTVHANYASEPSDMQFFFGRAANQPLSTVTPTTSAAGEVHLAKLSIWNRVLSDSEIGDLYLAMP